MERWFTKAGASMGSGLPDPATAPAAASPVPQTAFENKPAPGQTGPKGLAGRQTFSRVNTGIPPTPDAGQSQQKSMAPLGAGFLPKTAQLETFMTTTAMPRPTLHDFIKTAMEASAAKVDLSLESARQVASTGDVLPSGTKTAAAQNHEVPTEYIDKLAGALNFVARSLNPKLAEETTEAGPGQGPNALETNKSGLPTGDGVLEAGQSGHSTQTPPMSPATAKLPGQEDDPGNTMETNVNMAHGEQPVEPIANEKTSAAHVNNLLALGLLKVAAAPNGQLYLVKTAFGAEDAGSYLGSTGGGATYGAIGGGLKGGALGGLGGAGLGAVGGGLAGLAAGGLGGAAAGALAGGLGGAALGGVGGAAVGGAHGGIKGGVKGFQRARAGGQAMAAQQQAAQEQAAAMPKAASVARRMAKLADMDSGEAVGRTVGGLGGAALGLKGAHTAVHGAEAMGPLIAAAMKQQGMHMPASAIANSGMGLKGKALMYGGGALAGLGLGGALGGSLGRTAGAPGEAYDMADEAIDPETKAQMAAAALSAGQGGGGMGMGALGAKQAAARLSARNLMVLGLYKQAEDAINPAQISAGKADATGAEAPSGAAPAGEEVPSEPSDVNSQKGKMLSSNEAAINYTKRDAKADPKSDVDDVLDEKALTSSTDKVLNEAWEHTDQAGAKISSITRVAAARAILSKLAEEMSGAKGGKKEKRAMGGNAPSTPQESSGFSASSVGGAGGGGM